MVLGAVSDIQESPEILEEYYLTFTMTTRLG
jgi:hypothetical protein